MKQSPISRDGNEFILSRAIFDSVAESSLYTAPIPHSPGQFEGAFRTLLHNIDQPAFIFDGVSSQCLDANRSGLRLLKLEPNQLGNAYLENFCSAEFLSSLRKTLMFSKETGWLKSELRISATKEISEGFDLFVEKIPFPRPDSWLVLLSGQERRGSEVTFSGREDSKKELEQIGHAVSHDLQEPLRMVTMYMELFAHRYGGKLDQDADDFIRFALDGSRRIKKLVDDLFTYTRAVTNTRPERIDLNAVVKRVTGCLRSDGQLDDAQIDCDTLPAVYADGKQMNQLFHQLIQNAAKFRERKDVAIWIRGREENNKLIVSVSDDGMGFEKIYGERIFGIFQRLHPRSEYGGTGMGLALCKKIVENHRGKIWAVSELGKGATFSFSLPLEAH